MRAVRITLTVVILALVVLAGQCTPPVHAAGCLMPGAYIPIIRYQPHADQLPCLPNRSDNACTEFTQ